MQLYNAYRFQFWNLYLNNVFSYAYIMLNMKLIDSVQAETLLFSIQYSPFLENLGFEICIGEILQSLIRVTSDVDDFDGNSFKMMVTVLRCWRRIHYVGDIFRSFDFFIPKNRSSTSQIGH